MLFHRAKPTSAPIDIAPGAAARLRHRPAFDSTESPRPPSAALAEAAASAAAAVAAAAESRAADALTLAHADRDAAIEEVEYLREQLRSTRAYLGHVFEMERAAGRVELASLLGELALLDGELRSRAGRDQGAPSRPPQSPTR